MVLGLLEGLSPLIRGILIALIGVGSWIVGLAVVEYLRRRWTE